MAPSSPSIIESYGVIYGGEIEEANAPDASQHEVGDDKSVSTPEEEEHKESMYVTILEDAIVGVIEHEQHLFKQPELDCLEAYNFLHVDVKFLYARCCARKLKWLRLSDMKNWQKRLGSDFAVALRELSGNPDLLMPTKPKARSERTATIRSHVPKRPRLSPNKRPLRANKPIEVISLLSDDDDDDAQPPVKARPTTSTSTSPGPSVQKDDGPDYTSFMQCRSVDSPDWNWPEVLEMLNVDELKEMIKMLVLRLPAKKRKENLIQTILSRVATGAPVGGKSGKSRQTSLHDFDSGLQHRQWVMKKLGVCVRFNGDIHELMLKVNIIYLRCTQLPDGFLTAPILDKSNRRSYNNVVYRRTGDIWKTRADFDHYYNLLHVAAAIDWLLTHGGSDKKPPADFRIDVLAYKDKSANAGFTRNAVISHAVWSIINERGLIDEWRGLIMASGDDEPRTRGMERFEAGHVLTRLVHKAADALGPLKRYEEELELSEELLEQKRWRLGRRGFWHERRTLILEHYAEDHKSPTARKTALQATFEALADPHTHIIHRESLDKRFHRLEKALKLPKEARHICAVQRRQLPEIRISATQVRSLMPTVQPEIDKTLRMTNAPAAITSFFPAQKTDAPSTPKSKSVAVPPPRKDAKKSARTGRTAWVGRDDLTVTVEQIALEHYEEQGYRGYHCEGGIIRTLFGLLFWDIIFAPVPGAFETPYQLAPLDMCDDTFATTRADAIAARAQEIRDGRAIEVFERVDAEHREKRTMCAAVNWDFAHDELKEILECFDGEALALLCELLCQDYSKRTSGLPDLFLWHPEKRKVKLSEVKSPNDKLAQHQKVWLEVLCGAGVDAEVCHVHDPEVKVKSEPSVKDEPKAEGKGKSPSKKSTSSKRKRVESEVESEPDWSDIEEIQADQVRGQGKSKDKAPATKGKALKRKRTAAKSEPDASDVEEMYVDQLRDDPQGEFSPASGQAASAPSDDDHVSTPPPPKRPHRAAAEGPKRYKFTDVEMQL